MKILINGVELKVGSAIMLKPYDCLSSTLGIDKREWQEFCEKPQTVETLDEGHSFGMKDFDFPVMPWRIPYEAIDRIIEPTEREP
ncbi:MAG: hypothetical protein ACYCWE_09775 [Eubacteriales bacterium]